VEPVTSELLLPKLKALDVITLSGKFVGKLKFKTVRKALSFPDTGVESAAGKMLGMSAASCPNYASAHQWHACLLAELGRSDQAKEEMAQALEIDPLSPNLNADMGEMCYFARQYDEGITYCKKALEVDSDFAPAREVLSSLYTVKGMHSEAVQEFTKAHNPQGLESWNDRSGWRGFFQSVIKSKKNRTFPAIYAQLGDKQAALDDLESDYGSGYLAFLFIKVDPSFDNLRAEPRFKSLLQRMGLKD
jgi:tetratricopeptide (TPR) repeat protein